MPNIGVTQQGPKILKSKISVVLKRPVYGFFLV